MRVRPGTAADREALEAIVAETPGLEFPEDVFAWPTIEILVVEDDDGEPIGFSYVQAIPEAHVVLKRRPVSHKKKQEALLHLHAAGTLLAQALRVPYVRLPVRQDLPQLVLWASQLPGIQGDPRTHLALVVNEEG